MTIEANEEILVLPLPSLPPISSDADIIQIDETEIVPQPAKSHEETKRRHQKKTEKPTQVQKGGYKTREEIHKPPTFDHPCNLTRTTVRISYPKLKHELFVNFLGYKEPNLVYLWRCKGTCGEATSPIACSPTRTSEKRVNMMFKVKVCIFRSRNSNLISG